MTIIYLTDKFIQTVLFMTFDVNYCENYVVKAVYCKCQTSTIFCIVNVQQKQARNINKRKLHRYS